MDLSQRRLRNQYINGSRLEDPAEVVRALGAVQAQDYYSALWAIGLRLRGACEATVEQAIAERRIVRTWPMRGTLHFVAAEDVRWLIGLLAPQTLQRNAARLRRDFRIDQPLITRTSKIVKAALSGGRALTRAALYEQLEAQGIETGQQRGMHILWWLAQEGLICCGPRAGKQHTFVLLDEWVPASSRRARARRATRSAPCHLLPVYDEYAVGYADRSAALGTANQVAAGHGIFRAPIVIAGNIVGSWARQIRKDRVDVSVVPLTRFSREQQRCIGEAAERYGSFLGLAVKVNES